MDPNVLRLAMGAAGAGGPEYQLWAWGGGTSGALGTGTITNRSSPVQVGALTDWAEISSSINIATSAAIKTDGTLWTWGAAGSGQLGLGSRVSFSSPMQVGSLTNWLKISVGGTHCAAIKTDGTLWTWGANGGGQLGTGNTTDISSPVQVGSLTDWSSVSAVTAGIGSGMTAAIKTNGTLWTWGSGDSGWLGLGNTTAYSSPKQVGSLTDWAMVAAGGNRFCTAVKTDGTLWTWGYGNDGQLGLGNKTFYSSPKQVGSLTNWSKVFASERSVIAIKTNGTLWSWGDGGNGRLGLGNLTAYSSPKQVGALTNWSTAAALYGSCAAIKTDGTLWTWGENNQGQLGLGDTTNRHSPVQVGSLTTWEKIARGGGKHMLATKKP